MRGRAPAHRAERRWQVRASIGILAVAVVVCGLLAGLVWLVTSIFI